MVLRQSLDLRGVVVVFPRLLDSPFVEARSRFVDDGFSRMLGSQVGGRLRSFSPGVGENHLRRLFTFGSRGRVLLRFCGTSSIWRPPEPLSDHVPSFQVHFSAEIVSLLEKGAIEEIRDHPLLCFSPVFVVPKCSGSLRMILLK